MNLNLFYLILVFARAFFSIATINAAEPCLESERNAPLTNLDVDLMNLSIDEILRQIQVRRVCCVEVTKYFLRRIREYNPILKAVITVDEIGALKDAEKLDDYFRKTEGKLKGRLHCVPTLIKDNIFVKNLPTTLGIRLFKNATAGEDAPVVAKLRREGAIILGKANMIMFAAGATDIGSETGGLAKNPYALNYTVVGSSTGNAVVLAARLAVLSLGSDSGGSITAPASATHIVGLRPATGSVDMRDVFPLLGQPFDTVGPMALNVKDIITVMDILQIGGVQESADIERPKKIRLGILRDLTFGVFNVSTPSLDANGYFTTTTYSVDPEIQDCFRTFQTRLDALSEKYNIENTLVTEDIAELAKPVLENENHRWSCIVSDMTRFLKLRPMRTSNGELIDNADRLALHRTTPFYYRSLFGFLSKRKSSCPGSRQKYAGHLSVVLRRLRRQIFDKGIDVVAMPTLNSLLWPWRSEPNSSGGGGGDSPYGHLHDLGGLFALPALNLPLCFSKPRPGAPQGLPIGVYFMTVPERVRTMLELANVYEKVYKDAQMPRMLA